MNMNTIINMVIRRITSILINKGINAGMNQMSKRKPPQQDPNRQG